jgi:hypothetical protein
MVSPPPEPPVLDPPPPGPLVLDPPVLDPPPVPPAGGVGGGSGGTDEPLVDGDAEGVGLVVDSTGLVVALGVGVADGLTGAGEGAAVAGAGRDATRRSSLVTGTPRRGSASMIARAFGAVKLGSGVRLGRTSTPSPWPPSSGNGRIALELTGPPARLTLMSPP